MALKKPLPTSYKSPLNCYNIGDVIYKFVLTMYRNGVSYLYDTPFLYILVYECIKLFHSV